MTPKVVIFWFRRDLRLEDNVGLYQALTSGLQVVPLFIFDTIILNDLDDKADKRVSFIYTALQKIQAQLVQSGSSLDVRFGSPQNIFRTLLKEYEVHAVYTNHDYEPYAIKRDEEIGTFLSSEGTAFYSYKDQVIFERNEVMKGDGGSYNIFTPYANKWRSCLKESSYHAFKSEDFLRQFYKQPALQFPSLKEMGFTYNKDIPSVESVDEDIIKHYHQTRNIPALQGTTRMGVHLRFGTVSVRRLVANAEALNAIYLNELIWREFFMQILWHYPEVEKQAFKKGYDKIKWRNNEAEFKLWCNGETGYPIVDAGMRELNETGFMHNRVRMIVASFLVKDLLIDWR
ncbi:MAG: DNA photolyase family protein, partial [Bacteroidota bacterium]|nr:DNA photolyase family protein [Bacteroidota bacterium]